MKPYPKLLSVTIITLNESARIKACIESVAFADEVVVIDSGSVDDTREIAKSLGARVIEKSWQGYGKQKQFAVEQAVNDWVLCLDADERVTPELAKEIRAVMQNPAYSGYAMPRCNRFMGRWLRHGEGYPDLSLRLFDRSKGRWSDDPIHEKVVLESEAGRLNGDLLHFSEDGVSTYLEKQNRYTTLQAHELKRRGKKFSLVQLILSPLFRFMKFYFLKRGFLDGAPGLIHIVVGCMNSFFKYAKLRELGGNEDR
ncbi:glycosyltransferase family 2 protein [Hahella aquimaris]|uniref:glycosyltransferase family 2 protein n=1 Tax=Hahella sp. HNIBRBA332 TaxID=3015983 RepID=UPI00273C553D|nr:glycosyltransferase family 2 protein [Hahella sp. HNIBRBA332]WLQ12217.1 glycosyltransferase family 2 protein [Hahella sp. HNIBRBA332]